MEFLHPTLTKLYQLPSAEKKHLVPELQRALAVENIAANYVSSGNQDNMVQALTKISNPSATAGDSSPPSKKSKRQSSSKSENSTDSAMIASSTTVNRPTKPNKVDQNNLRNVNNVVNS